MSTKIICIMGPTGAGKSALALRVAQTFNGCVINADSRQVYKDFPIITAQPSLAEQQLCPHNLYGFLDIDKKISAGRYANMAAAAIAQAAQQSLLPIIVGGTGLYLKALLEGIAPIPPVAEAVCHYWQERCTVESAPALYGVLQDIDPDYAARIHPNDRQRITRALEVFSGTGQTFSWWHRQAVPGGDYNILKFGVSLLLDDLTPKLELRIADMLQEGALAEAEQAKRRCADPKSPGWTGIGCAEVYQYLSGSITLEECRALWLTHTRSYAKRQLTWFNGQEKLDWLRPGLQTEEMVMIAVRNFLLNKKLRFV